MGTLRQPSTGAEHQLRGRALIGRSARADIVLVGHASSSEHASIAWDGSDWMLRDLKSRNGTLVNDCPLTARSLRLTAGDVITFGDPSERWCWTESSAPRAAAVRQDGVRLESHQRSLWLPNPDAPELAVYPSERGWLMEHDGSISVVSDGKSVTLRDGTFRLELPEIDPSLSRTRTLAQTRDIRAATVLFEVSSDEEHVVVTVRTPEGDRALPPHAFFYMLLVLARTRRADQAAGLREDDGGWIHVEDLIRQLTTDPMRLNVDICRARKLMDELGSFDNPEDLVQRRKGPKQLRLGIAYIEISSASQVDHR